MSYNKLKIFKTKIILIKSLITIMFIIYIAVFIFFLNGFIEKGVVKNNLQQFKDRGIFEKIDYVQGQNITYYRIKPKYDYEDASRFVFDSSSSSKHYIGSTTDIILTSRNPIRMYGDAIIRDIGGFVARNFFVGHATINITADGSQCIESVGNDEGFNGVRQVENQWFFTEVRYENDAQIILGLRLKNTTEEKRQTIVEDLKALIGRSYNKLLIFYSKDKYYCTDLISRVLKKNNINVNYDSFYTTGNDIIVSDETYLIYICERTSEGNFSIYYLSEVE